MAKGKNKKSSIEKKHSSTINKSGKIEKMNNTGDDAANKPAVQPVLDPEKPLKKDLMTILVTVSAAFLALVPVLFILQPIDSADSSTDKGFSNFSAIAFALSFIIGLFTISKIVDWFKEPDEKKQKCSWILILLQTLCFTAGSSLELLWVFSKRFGW